MEFLICELLCASVGKYIFNDSFLEEQVEMTFQFAETPTTAGLIDICLFVFFYRK